MNEPRCAGEPVTQLALSWLGHRFLVPGPRRECWEFYRSAGEARLAAGRLNNPSPWSR